MFGLRDRDMEWMIEAFSRYEEIEEVILFGSRAMGNEKKGSDVDLSLRGHRIHRETLLKVSDDLNETSPLPYYFDVLHDDEITNEQLRKHIDRVGVSIYKKSG